MTQDGIRGIDFIAISILVRLGFMFAAYLLAALYTRNYCHNRRTLLSLYMSNKFALSA